MKAYELYKLGKPNIQITPGFDPISSAPDMNLEAESIVKESLKNSGGGILNRIMKSFPWQETLFGIALIGCTIILVKMFPPKPTQRVKST